MHPTQTKLLMGSLVYFSFVNCIHVEKQGILEHYLGWVVVQVGTGFVFLQKEALCLFPERLFPERLFPERHYPNYTNPEFPIILFLLPLSLGSRIHGLVWTDTGRNNDIWDNDVREKDMDPLLSFVWSSQ